MKPFFRSALNRYRGELLFTLANYTTPFVGLLATAVAAAFIEPEQLGAIETILLVVPYASFLQLGVFNGLNRNLAFYKARGDIKTAKQMVNTSACVSWVVSGIGGVIALGVLLVNLLAEDKNPIVIGASLSLFSLLVFEPLNAHISSTFRSGQQFSSFGKIILTENALRGVYLFLPSLFGWVGRVVANGIRPLIGFILRWKKQPYPADGAFNYIAFKALLHAGTPLLICNYLWATLCVADQSLIAIFLGKTELGYYTLSRLLIMAMLVIPVTLGTLLYPRASAQYGRTGNPKDLRPFFWKALGINTLFYVPICVLAYLLLAPMVQWILPKYIPGIAAAQINILTCLTFVSSGPGVIAGVVKKNNPVIIAYVVGLATMWLIGFGICKRDVATIEQIALLRFYVSVGVSIFVLVYSFWLTAGATRRSSDGC